ncbi:TetR/AcrR family transcriptional regulator [Gulosibacter chungangensis]|uniref:TetR family transcriptional regulator n=1 Tax=Gulosibacter chungangensis TaxID=979746 RepID=A0A7J5BCV9_9MICO|nr:TetR family transcriptional regulator [Gulosibacter chungangensis]KAB1643651.1 TetR family transcriptional regulator [Gulosibacter chungangensis]
MSTTAAPRPPRGSGRDALIRATVETVAHEGVQGATSRKIAAQAGVHNTLITRLFGNRNALLTEATHWVFEQTHEAVELAVELALEPTAAKRFLRTYKADPSRQIFIYRIAIAPHDNADLQRVTTELYYDLLGRMQASLERNNFPSDIATARAVFAAVDGLVLQRVAELTDAQALEAFERLGIILRAYQTSVTAEEN